jgi:hypothetical protein
LNGSIALFVIMITAIGSVFGYIGLSYMENPATQVTGMVTGVYTYGGGFGNRFLIVIHTPSGQNLKAVDACNNVVINSTVTIWQGYAPTMYYYLNTC